MIASRGDVSLPAPNTNSAVSTPSRKITTKDNNTSPKACCPRSAASIRCWTWTLMVLWMMKASRSIKVHVQQRIDAALRGQQAFGLVLLSFVVILREGVEAALFVFGKIGRAS